MKILYSADNEIDSDYLFLSEHQRMLLFCEKRREKLGLSKVSGRWKRLKRKLIAMTIEEMNK